MGRHAMQYDGQVHAGEDRTATAAKLPLLARSAAPPLLSCQPPLPQLGPFHTLQQPCPPGGASAAPRCMGLTPSQRRPAQEAVGATMARQSDGCTSRYIGT